jgi:hypothetical protein
MSECRSATSKFIEIRSLNSLSTERRNRIETLIIGKNEHDVRAILFGGSQWDPHTKQTQKEKTMSQHQMISTDASENRRVSQRLS